MEFVTPGGGPNNKKGRRSYQDFVKNTTKESSRVIFDNIRDYCFSLGDNVLEDVRMHRVVFCKSMTFRWFADVEPTQDGEFLLLKIHKSRKEQPILYKIKSIQDVDSIKEEIKDAYAKI